MIERITEKEMMQRINHVKEQLIFTQGEGDMRFQEFRKWVRNQISEWYDNNEDYKKEIEEEDERLHERFGAESWYDVPESNKMHQLNLDGAELLVLREAITNAYHPRKYEPFDEEETRMLKRMKDKIHKKLGLNQWLRHLSDNEVEDLGAENYYDPMMQSRIDNNNCKHSYDDGEDAWVMKYSELMGVEDGLSYIEAGVKCEICGQERIGSWAVNEKEGFQITKGEEGRMPRMYGFYAAEEFGAEDEEAPKSKPTKSSNDFIEVGKIATITSRNDSYTGKILHIWETKQFTYMNVAFPLRPRDIEMNEEEIKNNNPYLYNFPIWLVNSNDRPKQTHWGMTLRQRHGEDGWERVSSVKHSYERTDFSIRKGQFRRSLGGSYFTCNLKTKPFNSEGFDAESERTFTVSKGPKRMYIVVEYNDGKELFLDGDGQKQFMEELAEAEATRDEILVEKLFGVGSDYHGIAEEVVEAEEFEASSNYDFSQIDKILQDMDEDGSIQLTNTDGSQVRRKALRIYENIRTVQESIKQLREENAETFRIDALENYLLRLKYDLDNELNNWAMVNMNAEEFGDEYKVIGIPEGYWEYDVISRQIEKGDRDDEMNHRVVARDVNRNDGRLITYLHNEALQRFENMGRSAEEFGDEGFEAQGYDEIEVEKYVDIDWETDPHPHPYDDDINNYEIFGEVRGYVEDAVERRGRDSGNGNIDVEIEVEDKEENEVVEKTVRVEYDYHLQGESFEATKGIDTYAQPFEELRIKPSKTKVGILLASIVAGGLLYANIMKED